MTACQLVRSRIDHTRHGTPSHFLSRKGLSIWIDLDRLNEADGQSAVFSRSIGLNLLSFHQSDYGPEFSAFRHANPAAGICPRAGTGHLPRCRKIETVHLLTFPRILGVAFNPVSRSMCCGTRQAATRCISMRSATPLAICMPMLVGRMAGRPFSQAAKIFHVSPFFPVSGDYRLRFAGPRDKPSVQVLMRYARFWVSQG